MNFCFGVGILLFPLSILARACTARVIVVGLSVSVGQSVCLSVHPSVHPSVRLSTVFLKSHGSSGLHTWNSFIHGYVMRKDA